MSFYSPTSEDPWLADFRGVEGAVREVAVSIQQRRQAGVGTVTHALLSSKLRSAIPQTEQQVHRLLERLDEWELRDLTPAEHERRTRLCEGLFSALKRADMDFNARRYQASGAAGGWGIEEDVDTREGTSHLSTDELRLDQQRLLREQDAGLDALAKVISSQKRIASAINIEVEGQNELLDDIAERTDNTQNRLIDTTDNVNVVIKKDRIWPYWLVIFMIFAAIIIILFV